MVLIRSGKGQGCSASRNASATACGPKGLSSSPSLRPPLSTARRWSRANSGWAQRALTRLTMLVTSRLSSYSSFSISWRWSASSSLAVISGFSLPLRKSSKRLAMCW
ncbi:hypothetical protein D9M71_398100 [compost metagenome]